VPSRLPRDDPRTRRRYQRCRRTPRREAGATELPRAALGPFPDGLEGRRDRDSGVRYRAPRPARSAALGLASRIRISRQRRRLVSRWPMASRLDLARGRFWRVWCRCSVSWTDTTSARPRATTGASVALVGGAGRFDHQLDRRLDRSGGLTPNGTAGSGGVLGWFSSGSVGGHRGLPQVNGVRDALSLRVGRWSVWKVGR
jgi:hypothetical protein